MLVTAEVPGLYSQVGLFIAFLPWQLAQHFEILRELVLREEASKSAPACLLQVLHVKRVMSSTRLFFKRDAVPF